MRYVNAMPLFVMVLGLGCSFSTENRLRRPLDSGPPLDPSGHGQGNGALLADGETYVIEECSDSQHSDDEQRDTRVVEVGSRGHVEKVLVQEGAITRLFFSSEILSAKSRNADIFGITVNRIINDDAEAPARQIAINPSKDGKSTILYVETADFEVIIDVVAVNDQVPNYSYISFVSREAEAQFKRRVKRAVDDELRPRVERLNAMQMRYTQLVQDLQKISNARAQDLLAHALWEEFMQDGHVDAWCRVKYNATTTELALRAGWVRWIGKRLFLVFSVEGMQDWRIERITLTGSDGIPRAMGHSTNIQGQQRHGSETRNHIAVAGLSDASALAGEQAVLHVDGPGLSKAAALPLRLPSSGCERRRWTHARR